jgi:hypothetical protein
MKTFSRAALVTFSPILLCLLGGCASTARQHAAAEHEAERARGLAAKSRYWAAQAAQQPPPTDDRFELLSLTVPEHVENGVIRTPSIELLRLPRTP